MKKMKWKQKLVAVCATALVTVPVWGTEHSIRWLWEEIVPVGSTKMESYHMPRFSEGLLAVSYQNSGLCGYINFFGEVVIEPSYLDATAFSQGVAAVKVRVPLEEVESGLASLLEQGAVPDWEEDIPLWEDDFPEWGEEPPLWEEDFPEYEEEFQELEDYLSGTSRLQERLYQQEMELVEGSLLLSRPEGSQGEAEELVTLGKRDVNGEIWVERYGYIDYSGNWVIPPLFQSAYGFSEGIASVELGTGQWAYINEYGRLLFEGTYDWGHDFQDGYAIVEEDGRYGLIDSTGAYVLSPSYAAMGGGDGIYPVGDGSGFGLVDLKGNLVQGYRYDNMGYFQEELALVEVNGKWGYVDNLGSLVIATDADQAFHFQDGYAWISHQGQCYYIDSSGNPRLVMDKLSQVTSFYEGYARGKSGHFYGFFDKTGVTRVPFIYRDAVPPSEGIGLVYDGVKWGLFYTQHHSSNWSKGYIAQAEEMGLIPTTFEGVDLSAPLTRGMFASLVVTMYEMLVDEDRIGEDVKNDPFYYPSLVENHFWDTRDLWVRRAFHLSLAFGVSTEEFGVYDFVTREQAAMMLVTLYQRITGEVLEPQGAPPFDDHDEIVSWSQNAVYILAEKGILTGVGDNLFAPKESISAETALVMALAMCYEMD